MKRLVTAAFSIALSTNLYAQIAVPFLQLPPDARHSGMGNIGVATSADASANFNNPAKLAFTDRTFGGNITRFAWLKQLTNDMHATNLSGYYKLKSRQDAIGVYYQAFDNGTVSFLAPNGQYNGTFQSLDQAVGVNYAKKIAKSISLGIGLKYINSKISSNNVITIDYNENSNAVAGDFGLFGIAGKKDNFKLNYGFALANIGGKIYYGKQGFDLPANFRIGLTPTFQKNKNKVLFGVEVNKNFYGVPLAYSIGTEYSFDNTVYARVGYWNGNDAFANYLTFGLGGRIMKQVGLDFAYRIGEGVVYNKTAQFSLVFDIKSFDKEVIKTL